jgi:hypothetical protein
LQAINTDAGCNRSKSVDESKRPTPPTTSTATSVVPKAVESSNSGRGGTGQSTLFRPSAPKTQPPGFGSSAFLAEPPMDLNLRGPLHHRRPQSWPVLAAIKHHHHRRRIHLRTLVIPLPKRTTPVLVKIVCNRPQTNLSSSSVPGGVGVGGTASFGSKVVWVQGVLLHFAVWVAAGGTPSFGSTPGAKQTNFLFGSIPLLEVQPTLLLVASMPTNNPTHHLELPPKDPKTTG